MHVTGGERPANFLTTTGEIRMLYRLIAPDWLKAKGQKAALEGEFTDVQIEQYNTIGYNIYYLPNHPSVYDPTTTVDGSHIDTFRFVYADMDLKDGKYQSKEAFIETILTQALDPTFIVDSGNGVHVYWQVSDLNAMTFLRLQRRICRQFKTDEAVAKIYQLMRVPGSINTKYEGAFKPCDQIYESDSVYTSEDLDNALAPISPGDEQYCKDHYNKTNNLDEEVKIEDKIPLKFNQLVRNNQEVKDIWSGLVDDRSKGDFRLAHIMMANEFTREEALSVLINSAKALTRAPKHRISYAINIVDKIWAHEEKDLSLMLSSSVKDILSKNNSEQLRGVRLPCWKYIDATDNGFRLGHVIGLVAGSGVGKTAIALNMFEGFVKNNPEYDHFFVPLEQPANEIAERWRALCGENTHLHDKVHVISNYDENNGYRHLSLREIEDYIVKFQQVTGRKVGAVVIDHVGVLKSLNKNGENEGLIGIFKSMKAFARRTQTLLVMQSQAPREKAGIGDLELNKDAAYGSVFFESFCDFLITMWQPLKRCYSEDGCLTITAFKFCKIRHKKQHLDDIKEDVCYSLFFDPSSERLRELTQLEQKSFDYFNTKATNKRKTDRKTDVVAYQSISWTKGEQSNGKANDNQNATRTTKLTAVP